MPSHDHFFKQLLLGTAPLILWGVHFFLAYILVAAVCTARSLGTAGTDPGVLRALLVFLSVLTIALVAGLLWRSLRPCSTRPGPELLDIARPGAALLALIGIIWTTVPMLLMDTCH